MTMTTDSDASIRERAYRIWEEEGRPEGREVDHWLLAVSQVGDQGEAIPALAVKKATPRKTSEKVVSIGEAAPAIAAKKAAAASKRKPRELN